MTAILRRLTFSEQPGIILAGGTRARVKGDQIIISVSASALGTPVPNPSQPRFPAILDTGNTFTFSIRESQLREWAGLDVRSLRRIGSIRLRGRYLPVYAALLWLHRNQPCQRDLATHEPPFRLEFRSGIVVYPNDFPDAPRLPLLGLRALRENRLHLRVDAERRLVSLRSPDWRTWLGHCLA
jgi:hypothetical protein